MTRLLSDIPRCYGIDGHPKCESCARKHQMERDDDTKWFPMVSGKPDDSGRCLLHIQEEAEPSRSSSGTTAAFTQPGRIR